MISPVSAREPSSSAAVANATRPAIVSATTKRVDFNPTTATPAQLAQYGLPPRPNTSYPYHISSSIIGIHANQTAYVEVWYEDPNAYVYYENINTGYSYQLPSFYVAEVNQDSAECIGEWPAGYGAYFPNYGSMAFQNCETSVNGGTDLYGPSHFYYNQIGQWYNGVRVQYPGPLLTDGTSFDLYWNGSTT
jgi:hypothetical protein